MNYSFDFEGIINLYSRLNELLKEKTQSIINKDTDKLAKIDEEVIVISEQLNNSNIADVLKNCSEEQKQELKKLGSEIKKQEENNKMLIKHSLDVINGLFSGILNITQKETCSYDAKGKNCTTSETYQISSITEEA